MAYAAVVACGYAATAGAYIAVSSRLAASASASVEELERWETTKGFLFVGTTALLLFGGTLVLFRRLGAHVREVARGREALRVTEHRATPGLLAAAVAHDLNNMLTVAMSASDELRHEGASPELIDELEASLRRAVELTRRLSRAGRGEVGEASTTSVADVVRTTLELLGHLGEARKRELKVELGRDAPRRLYRTLVEQVATNLFLNALEATPPGGRIEVRVEESTSGALLELHDDGPGFPESFQVQPFVTSKDHGTGLGLVSVEACAKAHGGRLELSRSTRLAGACVRVWFGDALPAGSGA